MELFKDKSNIEDIYPMSDIQLGMIYENIKDNLFITLYDGVLGYCPVVLSTLTGDPISNHQASGLATSEVLYFLDQISDLNKG